jgi:hypothetical protein
MCHTRSLLIDRFGMRREAIWFPYTARKTAWLKRILRTVWGTSLGRWLA